MLRKFPAIALLCGFAPMSYAADNGFYLGAGYAQSDYGISDPGNLPGFDDEDSGLKLIAGWRPLDNFGVEVNYVDHGNALVPPDTRLGAETLSGFAVGYLDFPLVDLFAKAGVTSWQYDVTTSGVNFDDSDLDFAWGVGIQARFWSIGARLEYEQFPVAGNETLDTISLSLTYTFL